MTLQAGPSGFFQYIYHSQHEVELVQQIINRHSFVHANQVKFMVLTDSTYRVKEFITLEDYIGKCPIDHAFMILAEKFAAV
jgi:hypothetical protein